MVSSPPSFLGPRHGLKAEAGSLRKGSPAWPRLSPSATALLSEGKSHCSVSRQPKAPLGKCSLPCHATLPSPFLPLFRVWILRLSSWWRFLWGIGKFGVW